MSGCMMFYKVTFQVLETDNNGKEPNSHLEFLLLGLPIQPECRNLFYVLFLAMYLTTILGNLLIIVLILLDTHLHTPMYLFLSKKLSFSDLCFSSVTIPELLQNIQSQDPSIPYAGCLTKIHFFLFFGGLGNFILVAMAYDRYVAICFSLHYTISMSPKLCLSLVVLSWVVTMFYSLLHILLIPRLSFCADNVIPHSFCEVSALLKLACSDTHVNELVLFIIAGTVVFIPFLLILVSHVCIVSSILKVSSARGIHKAFSTCGSHLSVVLLFYVTVIDLYLCPSAKKSTVKDTVMALMYMVVTPMLNLFIYSLRNRDIKGALGRVLCKKKIPFSV